MDMDIIVAPFIDGALAEPADARTEPVVNPSNGRQFLSIPAGTEADVDAAVKSARRAFDDGRWSDAAPSLRKSTLQRFAELIAAESASLEVRVMLDVARGRLRARVERCVRRDRCRPVPSRAQRCRGVV